MSLLDGVMDEVLDDDMGAVDASVAGARGGGSGSVKFVVVDRRSLVSEGDTVDQLFDLKGLVSLAEYRSVVGRAPEADDQMTVDGVVYQVDDCTELARQGVEVLLKANVKREALASGGDQMKRQS